MPNVALIDFPAFHTSPEHECACEVQTLLCAADALCRRFLEQPDVVREAVFDIFRAHGRLALLLSALTCQPRMEAAE